MTEDQDVDLVTKIWYRKQILKEAVGQSRERFFKELI